MEFIFDYDEVSEMLLNLIKMFNINKMKKKTIIITSVGLNIDVHLT